MELGGRDTLSTQRLAGHKKAMIQRIILFPLGLSVVQTGACEVLVGTVVDQTSCGSCPMICDRNSGVTAIRLSKRLTWMRLRQHIKTVPPNNVTLHEAPSFTEKNQQKNRFTRPDFARVNTPMKPALSVARRTAICRVA